MPDESGFKLIEELHDKQDLAGESNPLNPAQPAQPGAWGRIDRMRLLLWAAIAFFVPMVLVFGFHLAGARSSVLTVQSELPIKAIMTLFVCLATWIVSRIEKRPVDDYGIPLRRAFGKRFWEGTIWGFGMLSAIVLALRLSGHFRIESVALARNEFFRWALAWGATFLAVSMSEEFAFRGYWLFSMSRRLRFWPAALFLSAVFGVAHLGNHGENVLGILQVVVTGLLFCLMIRRTGSLCGLGLGGDIFLWHARQWPAWRGPISKQLCAGAELDHGRFGRTGRQHLRNSRSASVRTAHPRSVSESDLSGSPSLGAPSAIRLAVPPPCIAPPISERVL